MRLEPLVGQWRAIFQEDVALVAVDHSLSCSLVPKPVSLPDLDAAFSRGRHAFRLTREASRSRTAGAEPPPHALVPSFNAEAPSFVPAPAPDAQGADGGAGAGGMEPVKVAMSEGEAAVRVQRWWRGRWEKVVAARAGAVGGGVGGKGVWGWGGAVGRRRRLGGAFRTFTAGGMRGSTKMRGRWGSGCTTAGRCCSSRSRLTSRLHPVLRTTKPSNYSAPRPLPRSLLSSRQISRSMDVGLCFQNGSVHHPRQKIQPRPFPLLKSWENELMFAPLLAHERRVRWVWQAVELQGAVRA